MSAITVSLIDEKVRNQEKLCTGGPSLCLMKGLPRKRQGVFLFCYFLNFRQTNAVYLEDAGSKVQYS